jgi:hypothetical protein
MTVLSVLYPVLWFGIVLVPIRVRLIQIRILPHLLHMLKIKKKFYLQQSQSILL